MSAKAPLEPGTPQVSLLQQRAIEARIAGPLLRAFQQELGVERANDIARRAVASIALQFGHEMARRIGRSDLQALGEVMDLFQGQGDLELQILERSATRYAFNVTRCRFAEMYRALEMEDLGTLLSCGRDYSLARGMDPSIRLQRTQTMMEGAPYCDFRFARDEAAPGERPA